MYREIFVPDLKTALKEIGQLLRSHPSADVQFKRMNDRRIRLVFWDSSYEPIF